MNIFFRLSLSCLVALSATRSLSAQAPPEAPQPAPPVVLTQPPVVLTKPPAPQPTAEAADLQFNFDGTPWRDVINWLAEDAQLALHVRDLPTGSFTYSDPQTYTNQGAIERVNLFLLGQGFTLVRSGQLLSVINLEDPRSIQQLDALARLVTVEQLATTSEYDVVKCIFPLNELKAEDAVDEISALKLLTEPAVFKKTNRLLITDTVRKLRSVKAILDAFEPQTLDNGTVMKNFALKNVDAEDILLVARPHLGLATGEMIGIDVSLSADLQGKNIFVTGVADKVKLIEGLVEALDKADTSLSEEAGAELISHPVRGGNVETVYNVLQTLLAQKSVRLSMDSKAEAIVALATPNIQKEISATVKQLEASEAQFEVIPLKTVDPYFAITLIEQMLDIPGPYDTPTPATTSYRGEDGRRREQPVEVIEHPKIDADPGNMRLFVRGKKSQIDQIKKIVEGLDNPTVTSSETERLRLYPAKGKGAERLLRTAASFWRDTNPVIFYPSNIASEAPRERIVAPMNADAKATAPQDVAANKLPNNVQAPLVLAGKVQAGTSPIRCQITPRGLLLQCEDAEILAKFYEHIQSIEGPTDALAVAPVVFYLKYAKPDDAIRMLAEMLDGGEAAKVGEAGTLVNGYVSGNSTSYLGSLITTSSGTTTMTSETITVVAESRLNRLIVQGTEADVSVIDGYLKIIDKQKSITNVETYGQTRVIELQYAKAVEVAEAIREAFSGRVNATSRGGAPGAQQGGRPNPQGGQQQPQPQQAQQVAKAQGGDQGNKKAAKAPRPGAGGQTPKDLEPKITVAVHEASNSLIITAPEDLFEQVEALAKHIDQRNEIVVEIFPTNTPGVAEALQQVFGTEETAARGNTAGSGNARPSTPPPSRPANPAQRPPRIDQK